MSSYWQREAGWCDRWLGPVPASVDFAVLGAGLAGLATAIRLRERDAGARIAVLEAERVGFGASGRSAGFLSPLAAPVWLLGAERSYDEAWGAAQINTAVHAVARWLATHVPDAELQPAMLSLEAGGRIADRALGEFARAVERVGLAHRVLESRARRGHLFLEMAAYSVHPYKLVRGLAEHAERSGIVVCERARVRAIEADAYGARLHVDGERELRARRVVVCTNAYTSSLDIGERVRSAVVVHSFMAATAPGPQLVRDGDFTVEINPAQVFHRMHGGRLLYGGIDKLVAPAGGEFAVPARVRSKLARLMRSSFDRELEIAESWSGRFHATPSGLPIIRPSATNPNVILNVGYGGTGFALALACAPLAAAVAAGDAASTDEARLLSLIRGTRIKVRDVVKTLARIAGRLARPR